MRSKAVAPILARTPFSHRPSTYAVRALAGTVTHTRAYGSSARRHTERYQQESRMGEAPVYDQ